MGGNAMSTDLRSCACRYWHALLRVQTLNARSIDVRLHVRILFLLNASLSTCTWEQDSKAWGLSESSDLLWSRGLLSPTVKIAYCWVVPSSTPATSYFPFLNHSELSCSKIIAITERGYDYSSYVADCCEVGLKDSHPTFVLWSSRWMVTRNTYQQNKLKS